MIRDAYYLHTLKKCTLVADKEELVDVLEGLRPDSNLKETALAFEPAYK